MAEGARFCLTGGVNLRAAAEALGVHYQTAYRWVRDGSLPAVKRGRTYDVAAEDLASFVERRQRPSSPPPIRVRSWPEQVDRLYQALMAGDEQAATGIAERLAANGAAVTTLAEKLLAPALHRIGEAWAEGRLSIAEEHRASGICERILVRVSPAPRGRPRGVAVVATAPGDQHGLPSLMAASALRADRWRVHDLGTQVPPAELAALARKEGADLVVLSLTNEAARPAVEESARAARATGAAVVVGSPGSSLATLVDTARAVHSASSPASRERPRLSPAPPPERGSPGLPPAGRPGPGRASS